MAEIQEDCRRLANVETGEKETPLGEKVTPLGEKVTKVGEKANFVGEKKIIGHAGLPGSRQPVGEHHQSQGPGTKHSTTSNASTITSITTRKRGGDTGGTTCMNVCMIGNRVTHR